VHDDDLRALERRAQEHPHDAELANRLLVARRRAGQPVDVDLLERVVFPARRLRADLAFDVRAALPDGRIVDLGSTPAPDGVAVPEHRLLWVAPRDAHHDEAVLSQLSEHDIPGVDLSSHVTVRRPTFQRLVELPHLDVLGLREVRGLASEDWAQLGRLGTLRKLILWDQEGPLDHLGGLRELTDLRLVCGASPPLEKLQQATKLVRLALDNNRFPDPEALLPLARLPHLSELDLEDTQLGEDTADIRDEHLAPLDRVRRLRLGGETSELPSLFLGRGGAWPQDHPLEDLTLVFVPELREEDFERLARHPRLRRLELRTYGGDWANPAGIWRAVPEGGFAQLEELEIDQIAIYEEEDENPAAAIGRLPRLRSIVADEVEGRALEHLARLPRLERVRVKKPIPATEKERREFTEARPEVKLEASFEPLARRGRRAWWQFWSR
jgi:hypothetical protein